MNNNDINRELKETHPNSARESIKATSGATSVKGGPKGKSPAGKKKGKATKGGKKKKDANDPFAGVKA